MEKIWQTSRRKIDYGEKTLVMAILNVTHDSFFDGGKYLSIDDALRKTETLIEEGADILDVGGESTRPKSERIPVQEEIKRVVPIIEAITKRFDVPVSVDTTKFEVAESSLQFGAEIINDVSGLRFDARIAEIAAKNNSGLVLMHLRGTFETMHRQEQPAAEDILSEVAAGFRQSVETAENCGVKRENIALDIGIGFSKTFKQNLELIAKLDKLIIDFSQFPMLVGASRKSFIAKVIGGEISPAERLPGSLASMGIAVWNGANIVRVHDVKETVQALKTIEAIKREL
jgi:dihydropteroate synthase